MGARLDADVDLAIGALLSYRLYARFGVLGDEGGKVRRVKLTSCQ